MMTIKDFARLCGCNAQTLRYYDRIQLLRPARVDEWSGYRYYEQKQAIDFVKIKNLQLAEFSIDEIKQLLQQTDQEVYDAFGRKIAEQQEKLSRILEIQKTYLKEKTMMEQVIQKLSGVMLSQIDDPEILREFGLDNGEGKQVVKEIADYLEKWMLESSKDEENVELVFNDQTVRGAENILHKLDGLDQNALNNLVLGDEDEVAEKHYEVDRDLVVWEKHGWEHVHEFIDEIPALAEGKSYILLFHLPDVDRFPSKIAFPIGMIGAMVYKHKAEKVSMGCEIERSPDGQNHFWLMMEK